MLEKKLTEGIIQINDNPNNFLLKLGFINSELISTPFFLVIKSESSKCARLTLYPIKEKTIIKICLSGPIVSERLIQELSKIIQNFEVIHTSGLLIKGEELFYECYLDLNLTDIKYKDLIIALDKIHNIFKLITIEEIGLEQKTQAGD